jgi:TPR repeat protein
MQSTFTSEEIIQFSFGETEGENETPNIVEVYNAFKEYLSPTTFWRESQNILNILKTKFKITDPSKLLSLFQPLADNGTPTDKSEFGNLLLNGFLGKINTSFIFQYYKVAAEEGKGEYAYLFSKLILQGKFGRIDYDLAKQYFKLYADSCSVAEKIKYADAILEGKFRVINIEEAKSYYKSAADSDNFEAKIKYADAILEGKFQVIDIEEAKSYYKNAADSDNFKAKIKYAEFLLNSNPNDLELIEAHSYYRVGASTGDPITRYNYANAILENKFPVRDLSEAEFFYQANADSGPPFYKIKYAYLMSKGIFGEPNYDKVRHYFTSFIIFCKAEDLWIYIDSILINCFDLITPFSKNPVFTQDCFWDRFDKVLGVFQKLCPDFTIQDFYDLSIKVAACGSCYDKLRYAKMIFNETLPGNITEVMRFIHLSQDIIPMNCLELLKQVREYRRKKAIYQHLKNDGKIQDHLSPNDVTF